MPDAASPDAALKTCVCLVSDDRLQKNGRITLVHLTFNINLSVGTIQKNKYQIVQTHIHTWTIEVHKSCKEVTGK